MLNMINKNKIKLCYIIPSLDKGGAERFLVDLILNLDRQIFEPQLILFKRGGDFLQELTTINLPIIILEKKYRFDIKNFYQLFRAVKRFNPQIVHTQLGGDLYGRLVAKLLGVPIIISTEQNVNPDETWIKNKLKKITGRWADKIVAISQAVANDLQKRYQVNPQKIIIIPNGLNIDKFSSQKDSVNKNIKRSTVLCGTIGRLVPQKGQSVLIKAFKSLNQAPVRCLIAGQGPLGANLQTEIKNAGLSDQIKLVGEVDSVLFLKNLDIFILPSLWEGQGIVLLEAALSGKPIIASRVDGICEIIDEQTGFLVPAGDSQALANAIDYLTKHLNDQAIYHKIEKLKLRVIEHYDIKKISNTYISLYQELLNKNSVAQKNNHDL